MRANTSHTTALLCWPGFCEEQQFWCTEGRGLFLQDRPEHICRKGTPARWLQRILAAHAYAIPLRLQDPQPHTDMPAGSTQLSAVPYSCVTNTAHNTRRSSPHVRRICVAQTLQEFDHAHGFSWKACAFQELAVQLHKDCIRFAPLQHGLHAGSCGSMTVCITGRIAGLMTTSHI